MPIKLSFGKQLIRIDFILDRFVLFCLPINSVADSMTPQLHLLNESYVEILWSAIYLTRFTIINVMASLPEVISNLFYWNWHIIYRTEMYNVSQHLIVALFSLFVSII